MQKKEKVKRYPALSYPDFRLLLMGQIISNTGNQMQLVALNWHIYVLTHSAAALGIIGLARFVPILIFSLIGGSFADSHNRKKILFFSQVTMMLFSGLLSVLTWGGHITPLMIYVITGLACIPMAFEQPARQALIPNLLDRKHLHNAISIGSISWQVTTILGPMIAGFLLGSFPIEIVYIANTFSFLGVIIALACMKTSGEVLGIKSPVSLKSIIEGLTFIRSKTILWSTMLLDFFGSFFASATALLPIFAKDILHVGPQGLGLLYAAPSVGAVAAGVFLAHKQELRNQGVILLSAVGCYGIGTIIFGFSANILISLGALLLIGMGDSISMIIRNTIRQLTAPDAMRGRMTSAHMIFAMGGPQLGELEAGLLAAAVGGPLSVIVGGIGTIVVVGIIAVKIPILRRFDTHSSPVDL